MTQKLTQKQLYNRIITYQKLARQKARLDRAMQQLEKELSAYHIDVSESTPLLQILPKGITLRGDGRYMGRVMYQKTSYTIYGHDPDRLALELEQLRQQLRSGNYKKTCTCTLDQLWEVWLRDYKSGQIKPTTRRIYVSAYRTHIQPSLGSLKLADITTEQLQYVLNHTASCVAQSTLNRVYQILNMLFSHAFKNDMLEKNPLKQTILPSLRESKEQRVLTEQEQRLFAEHAAENKYGSIFLLALFTGLRSGELRGLDWSDIDFEHDLIHVRSTLSCLNNHYYRDVPKSKAGKRDIPLLPFARELLLKQKEWQSSIKSADGQSWKPDPALENLVFTNHSGLPLSGNVLLYHMDRIQADIRKGHPEWLNIHPHTLRHTFATRAIEGGMNPQTLKAILGHASLSITMDQYSHVLPDTKQRQMQQIEPRLLLCQ